MYKKRNLGTVSINVTYTSYFYPHAKTKITQDLQREEIKLISYRLHFYNFMSPECTFYLRFIMWHCRMTYEYHMFYYSPQLLYGALIFGVLYSSAPVSTDSLSAIDRGQKKKLKIE
jgi:hypothetical protein